MKGAFLLLFLVALWGSVQSASPFNATVKVANGWLNGRNDGKGHKVNNLIIVSFRLHSIFDIFVIYF